MAVSPPRWRRGRKALQQRYLIAAVSALIAASPARADNACKVGTIAELPVTMAGLRPLVHAKINGQEARFIADSGAWYSMISPGSAAEFGLELSNLPPFFRMTGVGGAIDSKLTVVKSFTLAG